MTNTHPTMLFLLIAVSSICPLTCSLSQNFAVKSSPSGGYEVFVEGQKWLGSASTFLRSENKLWSTHGDTLVLRGKPSESWGKDVIGSWEMIRYQYKLRTNDTCKMSVGIKIYRNKNIAIFSQAFPEGLHNSSSGDMNGVISSFPSFNVDGDGSLGLLSFGGLMAGFRGLKAQRFIKPLTLSSGLEAGPLVLFNKSGPTLVVSAFSEFMTSSMWYNTTAQSLHWGIMGKAFRLPKGYETKTMLFYSPDGINKAVSGWGDVLRLWYKKDPILPSQDLTVSHLGYYTDNGAFFYHNTYRFKNYEEALLTVVDIARSRHIPYRYIQYDDWWYFIRGPGYGATMRWETMPDIFPHGLKYMLNWTGLPVLAHNRYWSSSTPYAKQNGGKFEFTMYQKLAMPAEESFWDWLFSVARSWGLVTYEQDWLNYQTERIFPLHSDVELAGRWLRQMGAAAVRHNLTIQYCMSLPRHVLQSLEIPAVTQVRVSLDYLSTEEQWRIGITSMFASAVGLAPFKDNFWSLEYQPGNPYNKTEKSPLLEAMVSILSAGPVAPGDFFSGPLISKLHRKNGLLLKPARPAFAVDAQIHEMAFADGSGPQGEVWTTYTDVSGLRFGIIFVANLTRPYKIGPSLTGFSPQTHPMLSYSYTEDGRPGKLSKFSDQHPLELTTCTSRKPCLIYTSPSLSIGPKSVVILGELDKFIPMSPQRVRQVTFTAGDVQVLITGVQGEIVDFYFQVDIGFIRISCQNFGPSGLSRINVLSGICRSVF